MKINYGLAPTWADLTFLMAENLRTTVITPTTPPRCRIMGYGLCMKTGNMKCGLVHCRGGLTASIAIQITLQLTILVKQETITTSLLLKKTKRGIYGLALMKEYSSLIKKETS